MEKRKQHIIVFWPVGNWLVIGGISAFFLWLGLGHPLGFGKDWRLATWTTMTVFAFFAVWLVWTPVPVVARGSLWLVRLFGLYWKRVRGRDLGAVVMMSHSLILKDRKGWSDQVDSLSMHRNRCLADTLHERFGVEIKLHRP